MKILKLNKKKKIISEIFFISLAITLLSSCVVNTSNLKNNNESQKSNVTSEIQYKARENFNNKNFNAYKNEKSSSDFVLNNNNLTYFPQIDKINLTSNESNPNIYIDELKMNKINSDNKNNNAKSNVNKHFYLSKKEYEFEDLITSSIGENKSSKDSKVNEAKKKCRVLVLQGGGDKGAYQAGVIKALSTLLPESERNWDVITGISVGAMNAAVLSIYEKGDEIAAAEFLLEKWKNLQDNSDIYKSWLLGPIEGYFYKSGFYDTTPMKDFIDIILADKNKEIKRKLVIGATDIKNGAYVRFNEDYLSQSPENFRDAIMASAAYPVIFPNIPIGKQTFMDGGVKAVVDIPAGINKCFDMGFNADEVFIDMILCNAISISDYDKESYNPIQILLRILELYSYEKTVRDIQDSMAFYKNVQWRYLVKPKKGLPWNENPLNFTPEQIQEMIDAGLTDAKEVLQKEHGFFFREFNNFFMLEKNDFFEVKFPAYNFYLNNHKAQSKNESKNN